MQVGVVLSQNELGPDVNALREYAQGVQELGYEFLVTSDHVLGSDAADHPDLPRVYPVDTFLREPLVLGAFLAAAAPGLGYLVSVVILPQRQTVLVAKQAADLDSLNQGKLRLGVGIGWNPLEFDALGVSFARRGSRFEEQIELMRRLWTERTVTFSGAFHQVNAGGLNARPVQQPIPIWIGANSEVAMKRATRIADGFLPLRPLEGGWPATMDKVMGWLAEAGRAPDTFGIDGRVDAASGTPDDWRRTSDMWRGFGATHLTVNTGGLGSGVGRHLDRLREVRQVLEP